MIFKTTIIAFLVINNYSFAQCSKCNYFDSTNFTKKRNIRDTIYFKATLLSIGKVSQRTTVEKLHLKGFIDYKNYRTAIGFIPVQTDSIMYLPYKDRDPIIYQKLLSNQNKKRIICLMGIIIRGFEKVNNKPFFLIDRVWFEN